MSITVRRTVWVIAAWLAVGTACKSSQGSSGGFEPKYDTWHLIMENVMGPTFEELMLREAEGSGDMDLAAIAKGAEQCANYLSLGYGVHVDRDVPDFADFARQGETWFRTMEAKAQAGEAADVRDLILKTEVKVCDRCHDAAGV